MLLFNLLLDANNVGPFLQQCSLKLPNVILGVNAPSKNVPHVFNRRKLLKEIEMTIQVSQCGFPQKLDVCNSLNADGRCPAVKPWRHWFERKAQHNYVTTICLHKSAVIVSRTITSSVLPLLWIPPQTITDPPPYLSLCCTLVTSTRSPFARHT